MSIARKDDRHNEDLVREISDGFNRAVGAKREKEEGDTEPQEQPRFVVTGDMRTPPQTGRDKRL
ncbi:hypothetical protein [Prauserella cavernicola]|uniref:Uncharacterized protein n=1 Tax=Prauserella cavernicola TaxID=2800127 RepID=A0A934QZ30_9PSEU|nr:hypothetical protein [Prauserella cavernicola]MBK1788885.1 hypothetical protein [Prauserella cavernicola]